MRRFIAALFAFALLSAPAMALPPTFNGNIIQGTTPAVDARFYGVKCDGSNDDTTAAQSAITAAAQLSASKGATNVIFPGGTCQFSSTLNVNISNVNIIGMGADMEQDVGNNCTSATTFKWIGSNSNPIVQISAVSGVSNQEVYASGIRNVCFTSNTINKASHALSVLSVKGGIFEHLFADSTFGGSKYYFGTVSQLGAHTDDEHNLLVDMVCTGVSGDSQDCLYLDGGGTPLGNFSLNTIINFDAQYYGGNGITCNNADNNVFINVQTFMTNGGSGKALDLKANCASNYFLRASFGPNTATWLAETGSKDNTVTGLDVGSNASPFPTIQSGASLSYSEDTAIHYNEGTVNDIVGENRASVTQGRTNDDTSASLYVFNQSADAIVLDDGTNKWRLNINGSSGLRITQAAGTAAPFTIGASVSSTGGITSTGGNISSTTGTVAGSLHNACASASGLPCSLQVSCSMSASTSCNSTASSVPNLGEFCSATYDHASTVTLTALLPITVSQSSGSFTAYANAGSSQTGTVTFDVVCGE